MNRFKIYQKQFIRGLISTTALSLITLNLATVCFGYSSWSSNALYKAGDLYTWNGQTYKCLQSHTSLNGWEPSSAPSLWLPVSEVPDPTLHSGRIIYHSYSDYSALDSKLYLFSLQDNALTCLSDSWSTVRNCMNAHFSPDGKRIVFMGYPANAEDWDIFLYTFGEDEPVSLTHQYQTRDEDPKFSPDGTKIIIKQTGTSYTLRELDLNGNILNTPYVSDTLEASMPYYSTNGQTLYYSAGAGAQSDIYSISINGSNNGPVYGCNENGIHEYYPVVQDAQTLYYTRGASLNEHRDQIWCKNISTGSIHALSINQSSGDCSDACPIHSDAMIFSYNNAGNYDLFLANLNDGTITSLNTLNTNINTSKQELGAMYTATNN